MRYVCRPAIAGPRLSVRGDGKVVYALRRPFTDGTVAVVFEPLAFLSRITSLVPPPRKNTTAYYGILAPAAKRRSEVVAGGGTQRKRPKDQRNRRRRLRFEEALLRGLGIDLVCPRCCGKMEVRQMVIGPAQAAYWLPQVHPYNARDGPQAQQAVS